MKVKSFFFISIIALSTMTNGQPEVIEATEQKEEHKVIVVTGKKAMALLAKKDAPTVIDIRTPEEFKEGHIEGARMIDFRAKNFKERLGKLDKNQSYLFHCKSGGRSSQSLSIWKELGFEKIYHLDSGILGWQKDGGKLVK